MSEQTNEQPIAEEMFGTSVHARPSRSSCPVSSPSHPSDSSGRLHASWACCLAVCPRLSLSLATVPEDLSPPLRRHDCTSVNQAHALVHPKAVNVWQGHSLRPAAPILLSVIVSKLTRTLQGRPYYPHFADRKRMLREVGNLPRAT